MSKPEKSINCLGTLSELIFLVVFTLSTFDIRVVLYYGIHDDIFSMIQNNEFLAEMKVGIMHFLYISQFWR